LRQALFIAGILEFTGAVLFGHKVSETLATKIVNPQYFVQTPHVLLIGMVAVLIACGIWLNIATAFGLPVSSSHATVGAIAGFAWVAVSPQAIDWHSIGIICLSWVATPIASGAIAAVFYSLIQRFILNHSDPLAQLREWIPWLSTALLGIFGVIVLPTISDPVRIWLCTSFDITLPRHDLPLGIGAIAAVSLTLTSWRQLQQERQNGSQSFDPVPKSHNLAHPQPPAVFSSISHTPSPQHPISPADAVVYPTKNPCIYVVESLLSRFQFLSACFVAFAHGSNDVGNAVAPLAAIAYIQQTGSVPLNGFPVPVWILALGGIGIVAGLAMWGSKVITTIGEGIIALRPSGGFCAELATATTILLASRVGLPVSTSHALVGGVVGVGLVKGWRLIQGQTLSAIALAWVITIPASAAMAAILVIAIQMIVR
jgi:PiT family inorganic phosphate transporter